MDALKRLQDWYLAQCNGEWEHHYGVFISNIDNPGWALRVELSETGLSGVEFSVFEEFREDERDWVHCEVADNEFLGFGGPNNLPELLTIFLDWADAH